MRLTSPKREARYKQLLQAALKVFARDGIDGASVADIAEAAGVAKGSVYLYFDSKEALAGDLVRHLFTYENTGEHRLSEEPDPLNRVINFCESQEHRIMSLGNDSKVALHMFGHIGKSSNDQLGRGIRQLIAESRFAVQVLLRRAMNLGLVPGCKDCGKGAEIVMAATYGTIHHALAMDNFAPSAELTVRDSVETVLKGLGAQL